MMALLMLAACDPIGDTCGRGRCPKGTCITIMADSPLKRSNQGWRDSRYPQVDNEWWCTRSCPSTKSCASGQCLEDPANSNTVVCATDSVDIVYYSRGHSILSGYANQQVISFDLLPNPSPAACLPDTANPIKTCQPKVDCDAGTFHSGDPTPGVQLTDGQSKTLLYCPGDPDNKLGPELPEGKVVKIYVDQD
jgi:hypothetical protein